MFVSAVNGYCRSEGVVAVFLQKKPEANRIYTTVIHSLTNADGYKEQGILLVYIFCNYFPCESGSEVLCDECVCVYVCLSVQQDISEIIRLIFTNFCACCLCPWLGPPAACLR